MIFRSPSPKPFQCLSRGEIAGKVNFGVYGSKLGQVTSLVSLTSQAYVCFGSRRSPSVSPLTSPSPHIALRDSTLEALRVTAPRSQSRQTVPCVQTGHQATISQHVGPKVTPKEAANMTRPTTPTSLKRKASDPNLSTFTIDALYDLTLLVGTPSHPKGL